LPSGQTFAIFDPAAPNGTVLAILNVDGQQQNEEKLEFRLLGGDGKFRVENLDSSKVGLLRLNQTGGEAEEPWNVTVLARMGQLETQQSLQVFIGCLGMDIHYVISRFMPAPMTRPQSQCRPNKQFKLRKMLPPAL
jgi:hypothetical protein